MTLSRENDPFAVSVPTPPTGGANLSPQERQIYEFMWNHRDRVPTLGYLISRNVSRWLVLAGSLAIAVTAMYAFDAVTASLDKTEGIDSKPFIVAMIVGLFFGVVFRDFGHAQTIRKLWFLEAAVLDFPKIERLLWGEGEAGMPTTPPYRDDQAPLAAIPVDEETSPGERGVR